MIIARLVVTRLVVTGILAGLAGYSAPAKADPVFLRCEKFTENNAQGASVIFVKVDLEKNDFYMKTIFDESWKAFRDVKHADDVIQVQEKRWVDRATGILRWDFATYQCQTTRPKVF